MFLRGAKATRRVLWYFAAVGDSVRRMQDTVIRKAVPGDVEALATLMGELGYPTSPGGMRARLARIFEHPAYRTLVAESGGLVVGMVGLEVGHYYEMDGGYARISALVVNSSHRRLGMGDALIQAAESEAVRAGAGHIFVNSGISRPEAHAFYESSRYEVTGYRFSKSLETGTP